MWFSVVVLGGSLLLAVTLFFLNMLSGSRLPAVFREYNREGDLNSVLDWIKAKNSAHRLSDVLDYLWIIEKDDLADQIYSALGFDIYPSRHTRFFACRLYKRMGKPEPSLDLAERLLTAYPGDDSILDLYLDVQLTFGKLDRVRELLPLCLQKKIKGTTFKKHHARLLAAEKKWDEAAEIMEKVATRDYVLYSNTFVPSSKRQIYDQWIANKTLHDQYLAEAQKQNA